MHRPEPEIEVGIQGMTPDDEDFKGSRFSEVRDAMFANPYQPIWGAPGASPLPVHAVTLRRALRGVLPGGAPFGFFAATRRAVDSHLDLRWGADRKGFRRLVHTNGVCLFGRWEITEETGYSGYFRRGSSGLVVARLSTCCTETRRGRMRSLGLVGRIYPTTDPEHSERLPTACFITQQDVGGEVDQSINQATFCNAPDTTAWRRGRGLPTLLVAGACSLLTDRQVTVRQLYQIAELALQPGQATRCPEFMRLRVDPAQPVVPGADLDLRDEVMAQIYDPGDPAAKRSLVYRIETSDDGDTRGWLLYERRTIRNWRQVGTLTLATIYLTHPRFSGRVSPWTPARTSPRPCSKPSFTSRIPTLPSNSS